MPSEKGSVSSTAGGRGSAVFKWLWVGSGGLNSTPSDTITGQPDQTRTGVKDYEDWLDGVFKLRVRTSTLKLDLSSSSEETEQWIDQKYQESFSLHAEPGEEANEICLQQTLEGKNESILENEPVHRDIMCPLQMSTGKVPFPYQEYLVAIFAPLPMSTWQVPPPYQGYLVAICAPRPMITWQVPLLYQGYQVAI